MAENPSLSVEGSLHSVNGEGVVRMECSIESDCDDVWSALTDPERLKNWYGRVEGDLRVGGEFTAFVLASEWDGRGRIDTCLPQRKLLVTMWEVEDAEHVVAVQLINDGGSTKLELEVRGLPLDLVWAYGAGWQVHLEDLGAYLSGQENLNAATRWDELEPHYQSLTILPL